MKRLAYVRSFFIFGCLMTTTTSTRADDDRLCPVVVVMGESIDDDEEEALRQALASADVNVASSTVGEQCEGGESIVVNVDKTNRTLRISTDKRHAEVDSFDEAAAHIALWWMTPMGLSSTNLANIPTAVLTDPAGETTESEAVVDSKADKANVDDDTVENDNKDHKREAVSVQAVEVETSPEDDTVRAGEPSARFWIGVHGGLSALAARSFEPQLDVIGLTADTQIGGLHLWADTQLAIAVYRLPLPAPWDFSRPPRANFIARPSFVVGAGYDVETKGLGIFTPGLSLGVLGEVNTDGGSRCPPNECGEGPPHPQRYLQAGPLVRASLSWRPAWTAESSLDGEPTSTTPNFLGVDWDFSIDPYISIAPVQTAISPSQRLQIGPPSFVVGANVGLRFGAGAL